MTSNIAAQPVVQTLIAQLLSEQIRQDFNFDPSVQKDFLQVRKLFKESIKFDELVRKASWFDRLLISKRSLDEYFVEDLTLAVRFAYRNMMRQAKKTHELKKKNDATAKFNKKELKQRFFTALGIQQIQKYGFFTRFFKYGMRSSREIAINKAMRARYLKLTNDLPEPPKDVASHAQRVALRGALLKEKFDDSVFQSLLLNYIYYALSKPGTIHEQFGRRNTLITLIKVIEIEHKVAIKNNLEYITPKSFAKLKIEMSADAIAYFAAYGVTGKMKAAILPEFHEFIYTPVSLESYLLATKKITPEEAKDMKPEDFANEIEAIKHLEDLKARLRLMVIEQELEIALER